MPVLSVCGKGTQEIRYTQYLSYFLDPTKMHGLGNNLFKAILEPEFQNLKTSFTLNTNTEVIPEIYLGSFTEKNKKISSFADVGIVNETQAIIIEHKILSGESMHPKSNLSQLKRYNRAIENNPYFQGKDIYKFYLTPTARTKTLDYGWNNMIHRDLIARAIPLMKSPDLSQVAKDNLLRFLMDLAMGPYQIVETTLQEIYGLGNNLLRGLQLADAMHFNRLISDHYQVIKLLTEV